MSDSTWYNDLTSLLKSRGHSDYEIEKIVARVKQYDIETTHDSIMESIDSGHFNLAKIIEDALADPES